MKTSPEIIRECYSYALTPMEENLVDIVIDGSFDIKSKEELRKKCTNFKNI